MFLLVCLELYPTCAERITMFKETQSIPSNMVSVYMLRNKLLAECCTQRMEKK
jgi:hypothetical protein